MKGCCSSRIIAFGVFRPKRVFAFQRKVRRNDISSSKPWWFSSSAHAAGKSTQLSPREVAHLEERLQSVVANRVKDPILQKTLQSLQWWPRRLLFENDILKVVLQLPSLLHPQLSELTEEVRRETQQQVDKWRRERPTTDADNGTTAYANNLPSLVDVQFGATRPVPYMIKFDDAKEAERLGPGLQHVAHVVAVYSCKGGVGKSTIAVNLAYELARLGGRIGLLDVDVYGPSLPVLLHPDDMIVRKSPLGATMVLPIQHRGVKVLSLGFVSPKSGVPGSGPSGGAAVMRGPMAGRVVTQLLKGTDWGELDILILDLPPGTGDVQLTICQDVMLSGAVAVSTPSKLAAIDTRKGIEMFTSLGVPTLAIVENMSYFVCEGGGKHYPFGKGLGGISHNNESISAVSGSNNNVFQLPISTLTNDANDCGQPLCLVRPTEASEELAVFHNLAQALSKEILLLQHGLRSDDAATDGGPQFVTFDGNPEKFELVSLQLTVHKSQPESFAVRLFSQKGATQVTVSAANLKSRNPKTGEKEKSVSDDDTSDDGLKPTTGMVHVFKAGSSKLFPATIDKKGRYGYAVTWANGATMIYSRLAIAIAAGGRPSSSEH